MNQGCGQRALGNFDFTDLPVCCLEARRRKARVSLFQGSRESAETRLRMIVGVGPTSHLWLPMRLAISKQALIWETFAGPIPVIFRSSPTEAPQFLSSPQIGLAGGEHDRWHSRPCLRCQREG